MNRQNESFGRKMTIIKFSVPVTPAQAELLTETELKANSFFKSFNVFGLYGPSGSTLAADYTIRSKLLAEAIPSTSRAAGRNIMSGFGIANIDLMLRKTGWPRSDASWLHSDFKNIAYLHVYTFYDDMVSKGGLK